MFTTAYSTLSRTFVGVAGALLLATTCLVAAAGPAANVSVSSQVAATQSQQLVA